ncbi:MAG: PEGA domain-containing protein [Planctomycetaceae bacterium]|nr:PEGA domain-containing protein [Planctomycetaceae bacterium]
MSCSVFSLLRRGVRWSIPDSEIGLTPMFASLWILWMACVHVSADDRISFTTEPRGAEISVNGKPFSRRTPAAVPVAAGDRVTLLKPGFEAHTLTIGQDTGPVSVSLHEITELRVRIETRTARMKDAGTDDLTVVILLNDDPATRRVLNHSGDDRRVGGVDRYEFQFRCRASEIRSVRLMAESGEDAWRCDYMVIRLAKSDGSVSQCFGGKVGKWLSGDAGEGLKSVVTPIRNPRFAWPQSPSKKERR